MRFLVFTLCAVLARPPAGLAQVDADEVNRRLQGVGDPVATEPVQDQDKRNGTIHLQGGKGNAPAPPPEPEPTALRGSGEISVEGWGEVVTSPDMALVISRVSAQGGTTEEAFQANAAALNQLNDTLREAGIEGNDIQIMGISVFPEYAHTDQREHSGSSQSRRIIAYQAINSINFSVRDLTLLDGALNRAVGIPGLAIGGIRFGVSDPSAPYAEARRKAFDDAVEGAEFYAQLADVELGGVEVISETNSAIRRQPELRAAFGRNAAAGPVAVWTDNLVYSAAVRVTWELRQEEK